MEVEDVVWLVVAGLLLPGAVGLLNPCLEPPNIWILSPTMLPVGVL